MNNSKILRGNMIKRKYLIKNKNVEGWFNWYQMIYQYMRIKPIKGFYFAIKRIIQSRQKNSKKILWNNKRRDRNETI